MTTILKILSIAILICTCANCVQDDDYSVPSNLNQVEHESLAVLVANSTELTIQQVKDLFVAGNPASLVTSNVYVKGYISSSDESGNFYKEFFIQNTPSNPTAAIKVVVDASDLFARYNLGREVYINLKNRYIGEVRTDDGVIAIGEQISVNGEVIPFRENSAYINILRSNITETIQPLPLSLTTIDTSHIGMYVSVTAQFPDNLNGALYVDAADSFDTTRALQTCAAYGYGPSKIVLETSTFANFKNLPLPTGGGTISGVISKNYNGSYLVMNLNSATDVNFDANRCTLEDNSQFHTVFYEDFNTATHNTDFNFTGWTNFNESGNRLWREKVVAGNGFTEMTAFSSNDASNISWLISPSILLDTQTNDVLSFQTAQQYLSSANNTLMVYIATDYDGVNVLSANWVPLGVQIASGVNPWNDWVASGLIDISSYSGMVNIAFKYIGSGTNTNLDGTLRIDNFKIEGI